MNFFTLFCVLLVVSAAGLSGCTGPVPAKSPENSALSSGTPTTAVPAFSPSITPSFTTATTQETVVNPGPLKTIRDSDLLFTMQVPESWEVRTEKMPIPEGYSGIVYTTYLYNYQGFVNTREFYIITYAISRDYDQALRTFYRTSWTPHPNESTVRINGITFDRFESKTKDTVNVGYVVRKSSANARGFASVIEYFVNSSSQYRQQDYESFISTFRYTGGNDMKSLVGEEIKK
jgi:hypothetical protein